MLICNQKFNSRQEISDLLGGDTQKGIAVSSQQGVILLFTKDDGLYKDYFYPNNTYDYCLYTGIGRKGNQYSLDNNMYSLNIDVLNHKRDKKSLLLFEKRNNKYHFVGVYELTETHQNIQPDDDNELRRVFVFHLKKTNDEY